MLRPLLAVVAASAVPLLAQTPNTLLVVADDVGVDAIGCYGLGSNPPPTPVVDGLAAAGVRFTNAQAPAVHLAVNDGAGNFTWRRRACRPRTRARRSSAVVTSTAMATSAAARRARRRGQVTGGAAAAMIAPMFTRQGAVFAMLAVSASAQTTWVVTGGGPALQNAITAAGVGDTLDVQPGTYDTITCGKGLRIRLRPGAVIDSGLCAVTIASLPAAERFQLDGGMVRGIAASNCAGTIVVDGVDVQLQQSCMMSGCTGPIVFDDVDYSGFAGSTPGALNVFNCTDVTFRQCHLPQLTVITSRAALQGCLLRPYGFSGPGIHLVSGALSISSTYVKGSQTVFFSIPQPAIQIDAGTLDLTGTSSLEALEYVLQPAPGIAANGGTTRIDPSTFIQGTPTVAGPGLVLTPPIPSLAVTHAATTMTVTTTAVPGNLLATFAGLPSPPYPTPWGEAWLLPTDPILDLAIVPPNGTGTFTRTFAAVPPFVVLVLQSVALDAQGGLTLGAPTRFAWN